MAYHIDFADVLNDDLARLRADDPAGFALWDAVIELLWENDAVLAELFFNSAVVPGPPRFDTSPVWSLTQSPHLYNLARIKLLRPDGTARSPYRLLYAIQHNPVAQVTLLGLMPRGVNYEVDDPFVARCLATYNHLGISRLPRPH
jgi:hypothetical protein